MVLTGSIGLFIPSMSRNRIDDSPRLDKTALCKPEAALPGNVYQHLKGKHHEERIYHHRPDPGFAAPLLPVRPLLASSAVSNITRCPSTAARADVKAEVLAARQAQAGLSVKETSAHFPKSAPGVLSRAAVKADYLQAQKGHP